MDNALVPSQTKAGSVAAYAVNLEAKTCTCPDHAEGGRTCKHFYAASIVHKRDVLPDGTVIEEKSITFTEKKVYRQDWPAYNTAQMTEKHRFQVLLHDLCAGIVDPPQHMGRKRVPTADKLFSSIFKVYSTVSSRRFNCDLQDATDRGYLSRPFHPNRVNEFMEDAELTPHLKAFIVRSSLPLKAIESDFAVDSSGFSVSKFVRWYDEKYGVTRSGHDWVKVHIATGVKTGVVTAAAIYDRDTNDSPILPELVRQTKENFDVKEVSADKGYLSVENVETIFAIGAVPYIHPKMNSTGAVGGRFEKMVRYYQYKQDEFLAHYHKRSNVESVFSAVKRKFGDHIRSRNQAAMVNETLAKFICNNLCCVILSQCELGIEAEFWKNDATSDAAPKILPMVRG